ncbi:MAG: hypothetical protein LWW75_09210, partial [Chlorobiales bacterium]|nr:hypothetical protein [Chlorobiales bacterium]
RPDLVAKLIANRQRHDAVIALNAKTEQQAKPTAKRYVTPASQKQIIEAMQSIERTKLKTYASVKAAGIDGDPYAGIPDSLEMAKISVAELDAWTREIRRTTFASGNKFQPLPTHDEAWQVFSRVFTELHPDKQTARTLLYTSAPELTDDDIRDASKLYWDLMSHPLRQRAWRLMPDDDKASIKTRYQNDPDGAMQATADYYAYL